MEPSEDTVSFDERGLRLNTADDSEIICKELESKQVKVLILQGNTFGIEASEIIGQELARHPELKEAHFKDMFTSRGREEVPVALGHLLKGINDSGAELTLLDLSDNAIGPIGAPAVIEFLGSPAAIKIEKLSLNNCGLGPEGSSTIAPYISKLTELREFICGRNRLENHGAKNMSGALSELNKLEILKMPQNGIHVEGFKSIINALMANIETITDVDFSDNTIKSEGAEALAKAISGSKCLRILRLDDCLLGNDGFSIICKALAKSQILGTMKEASFEGNEIEGEEIVDLITDTFTTCKSNFILNLLANDFIREELSALETLSPRFKILVDDPSDCDYTDSEDDYEDDSGDKGDD